MKYSIIFLSLFLFTACNSSELDELRTENEQLNLEMDSLKAMVKRTDDAFVIPYDSITRYMMPVTFGPPALAVGEEGEYTTLIAWSKLPQGIDVDWKLIEGEGLPISNDRKELYKRVAVSYPQLGEKDERGVYALTLPNGTQKVMMWIKSTEVK